MQDDRINHEYALKNLASNLLHQIFRDGSFDVLKCIEIANMLKNWEVVKPRPVVYEEYQENSNIPPVDILKHYLDLPSRGIARVLHLLMNNAGRWHNMNDIAVNLGLSPRSVRVLISVLRKHLRIIGLEDVINTEYRVGYSVNHQGVVRVVEKVASLKNVADTN